MFDLSPSDGLKILTHARFNHLHTIIRSGLESEHLEDHFIILSSGTTSSQIKGYALARTALIANAQAVNEHFSLTKDDVWGLSLPSYHVGGLSVLFRASLMGNRVVEFDKWEPNAWAKKIETEKVTITTVVPTQVYDLITQKIKAPKHLRFLVVGGDHLGSALEEKAINLGWPVIRTFGMTEVCSQIASGKIPGDRALHILPLHKVKTDSENRLWVKTPSLFTLQFALTDRINVTRKGELCDRDGYYKSQDRVEIEGHSLIHLGRIDDQIKVSGRLIDLQSMRNLLTSYAIEHGIYGKVEIDLESDERKGKVLGLSYLNGLEAIHIDDIKSLFLPVTIDRERKTESFDRTELGKLKKL